MLNPRKRVALLIDADNVSYKHSAKVLREAEPLGEPTIIQAYGNSGVVKKWTKAWPGNHVEEKATPGDVRARNSADISLIIEAVDRANEYDHLCLVSSDADFTLLARHLRNKGKTVTVFGGIRTKKCLRRAVDRFVELRESKKVQVAASPPRRSSSDKRAGKDNGLSQSPAV
jgi:uncharacterized LabA/DUF88 family protein